MPVQTWFANSQPQPGAPGLCALTVSPEQWRQVAQDFAAAAGRLLALWASADERGRTTIRAAFLAERRGLLLSVPLARPGDPLPGNRRALSGRRPYAAGDRGSHRIAIHRSGHPPVAAPRGLAGRLPAAD